MVENLSNICIVLHTQHWVHMIIPE